MQSKYAENDAPLVEACINKDAAAWAALVKKYTGLISLSISNRLKKYGFNPLCEDTEDIRQNILTSIWTDGLLAEVKNRNNIAYWLSMVSGNVAIEHMRRKMAAKNPRLVPIDDAPEIEAGNPDTPAKKELSEKIDRSIESLPPKEQLIIKLNLLHEMDYNNISEMLNIPIGTVSSCIKRTKEKLKEDLKDFF